MLGFPGCDLFSSLTALLEFVLENHWVSQVINVCMSSGLILFCVEDRTMSKWNRSFLCDWITSDAY